MIDSIRFGLQWLRHPRTTGAVAPSGRSLARAMIEALGPIAPEQVVIELGPGSGSFTRRFLRSRPETPLVAVERNPAFAELIRRRHPTVRLCEGCAGDLSGHLRNLEVPADAVGGVISGLPLLSLPDAVGRSIFTALAAVVPAGRRYVQFTYSQRSWGNIAVPGFRRLSSSRVLFNLPPASVLVFERLPDACETAERP